MYEENRKSGIDCLLCGSNTKLVYEAYPGYQIPSVFNIYYCSSCNTSFSMPRDESNGIYELVYKNGPLVRYYARYWEYAKIVKNKKKPLNYLAEKEDTYWAVTEAIKKVSKKEITSPNILEIGSGLGYLTYSLNCEGYNTIGIDISQEAVKNAISNYGDYYICADLNEYSIDNKNQFDIIIFTELIEHINDILSFMESIKKLLKPDGSVILTTPNKSFYESNVIWATDLPPVHCWWLSEQSIIYIGNKLNMDVFFINFSKWYSKHTIGVDVSKIPVPYTPPVFDIDGLLIANTRLKILKSLKKTLKKIKIFIYIYDKINYYRFRNKGNVIIPKERGLVICAILNLK